MHLWSVPRRRALGEKSLTPGWVGRVALLVPLGVYAFVWPFGLGLLSLGWMPPGAGWVGGVLLGAQGLALTAWLALQVGAGRALVAAGGIALAAWALEAVGVTTGLPFGPYRYTPALGAWLGPVPAAIPFAWVASVGSAYFLSRFWILDFGFWKAPNPSKIQNLKSKISIILLGAVLATLLEGVLETVATRVQGYWTWLTPPGTPGTLYAGVPVANFLTWFAASAILGLGIWALTEGHFAARRSYSWVPALIYGMNVIMFGVVNAAHGFGGPAWLAGGLLGLIGLMVVRRRHARAGEVV
jgi:putative membrane protein